jgi:hypothetical protein
MALWIHSPTSTGALQGCRQASFMAHKNANKLRIFCQEPSGRRFADFVQLRASLPRTTKDKQVYRYMPIINSKNSFWVPRSATRGGGDPEDSKSKLMVQVREHRADGEPSLVVGRGHILSWTMLSLIALTRQKQLAKSAQAASQPASQHWACLFQDCLSRRNSRSAKAFQFFLLRTRNGTARNNSQK